MGVDEIKGEAWISGKAKIREILFEGLREIGRGNFYPKEWREGIITPIHKKGDKDKIENYRGVTVMCTSYKLYATMLNERLREDLERREALEENQAGFRRGRGVIDNIYILRHGIENKIRNKGGKVYVLFLDLKAAFDNLNRDILWKSMEERGVNRGLIGRIREIYKETKCRVKVDGKISDEFWTKKGVRQGCPLSPTLFNVYIADLEQKLRKAQEGGMVIGGRRIWSLGYADDTVIVAEEEGEMKKLIRVMEKYMERKKLQVNVEKTKMMVFSKGGGRGRQKERKWDWMGEKLEETKVFEYLGFRMERNNGVREHIRERVKKARQAMGRIWSIGEKKFGGVWKYRKMLFESIVGSIVSYGAEVWGWEERKEVEMLQEKYGRWVLGVNFDTPGNIVREELKVEKIRVRLGKRALKFEEEVREERRDYY